MLVSCRENLQRNVYIIFVPTTFLKSLKTTDPDLESDPEPDFETDSDPEPDSDPDPKTDSDLDPEPDHDLNLLIIELNGG